MLAVCEHLGARTPELSQALGDSAQAWPWDQKSQRFVFLHLTIIKGRKTAGSEAPRSSRVELQLEFVCDYLVYHSGT